MSNSQPQKGDNTIEKIVFPTEKNMEEFKDLMDRLIKVSDPNTYSNCTDVLGLGAEKKSIKNLVCELKNDKDGVVCLKKFSSNSSIHAQLKHIMLNHLTEYFKANGYNKDKLLRFIVPKENVLKDEFSNPANIRKKFFEHATLFAKNYGIPISFLMNENFSEILNYGIFIQAGTRHKTIQEYLTGLENDSSANPIGIQKKSNELMVVVPPQKKEEIQKEKEIPKKVTEKKEEIIVEEKKDDKNPLSSSSSSPSNSLKNSVVLPVNENEKTKKISPSSSSPPLNMNENKKRKSPSSSELDEEKNLLKKSKTAESIQKTRKKTPSPPPQKKKGVKIEDKKKQLKKNEKPWDDLNKSDSSSESSSESESESNSESESSSD